MCGTSGVQCDDYVFVLIFFSSVQFILSHLLWFIQNRNKTLHLVIHTLDNEINTEC